MAADAGVKAPVQGVREDMLPGPASRAGQTAGRRPGAQPIKKRARFLLPCPLCRHGSSYRARLAPQQRLEPSVGPSCCCLPPLRGWMKTVPNSRRSCPGGSHGGRAKLRERRRRFGPGGAVTMPTLRYQCMRRMAVDVKPNCRAAFVPAVSCSRNTRVVWRRRETRVGPRGARKAIGGRSRGAGPRRRGAAAGESRGRSACARPGWRRSCEPGGGAHEGCRSANWGDWRAFGRCLFMLWDMSRRSAGRAMTVTLTVVLSAEPGVAAREGAGRLAVRGALRARAARARGQLLVPRPRRLSRV